MQDFKAYTFTKSYNGFLLQDFNRVFVQHRGADAVYLSGIDLYWTDVGCWQCRRADNNARAIGWLDDSEHVDLSCNTAC